MMKTAIVVTLSSLVAMADAKPRAFGSFKLVSQQPAVHKNRTLHERTQALASQVAACGDMVGKTFPLVKLHVAPDGSMLDVELKTKALAEETVTCVRSALAALRYPAPNKASVVTWVLVYNR